MYYLVVTYAFTTAFCLFGRCTVHEDTWTSKTGYKTEAECLAGADVIVGFVFKDVSPPVRATSYKCEFHDKQ
jgi:hypothetical protein